MSNDNTVLSVWTARGSHCVERGAIVRKFILKDGTRIPAIVVGTYYHYLPQKRPVGVLPVELTPAQAEALAKSQPDWAQDYARVRIYRARLGVSRSGRPKLFALDGEHGDGYDEKEAIVVARLDPPYRGRSWYAGAVDVGPCWAVHHGENPAGACARCPFGREAEKVTAITDDGILKGHRPLCDHVRLQGSTDDPDPKYLTGEEVPDIWHPYPCRDIVKGVRTGVGKSRIWQKVLIARKGAVWSVYRTSFSWDVRKIVPTELFMWDGASLLATTLDRPTEFRRVECPPRDDDD